jgi:putative modified peptide
MPTRFIPITEDEQQFSKLLERIITDKAFAKEMQSQPAEALQKAGYQLTKQQAQGLKSAKLAPAVSGPGAEAQLAFPLTRPVVSIITRGTRPVVSVVTKGTQPVVSVAVNTILAVSTAPTTPLTAGEVSTKKAELKA